MEAMSFNGSVDVLISRVVMVVWRMVLHLHVVYLASPVTVTVTVTVQPVLVLAIHSVRRLVYCNYRQHSIRHEYEIQ